MKNSFIIRRKKWIIGFGIFIVIMVLFTIISKSIYANTLPIVETCNPEEKYIEHAIKEEGIVVAGGEISVSILPNMLISSMHVQVGDSIKAGDPFLQIDTDDLKDLIEQKQARLTELNLQIQTALYNEQLEQKEKETLLNRLLEDQELQARIGETNVGRATEYYVQAVAALERARKTGNVISGGETEAQYIRAIMEAAYAEADAKSQRDKNNKDFERQIEDMKMPDKQDSGIEILKLQKKELQKELEKYQTVQSQEGIIYANQDGIITNIMVQVGGRSSDTAALLISDDSKNYQMRVTIPREQKEYISLGDRVEVKLAGSGAKEGTVEYVTEEIGGEFTLFIPLEKGVGVPGQSGTITLVSRGEKQQKCVSPLAVYANNSYSYVYVLSEREGILGKEYYIREVPVKEIDRNDSYVAIQADELNEESQIILSATKEYKKGDTVRWYP